METYLNNAIPENIRAALYLCRYDKEEKTIKVVHEILFEEPFDALQAYCNIPNPESQMASGATHEAFKEELKVLHDKLNDEEWVEELADCL